MVLSMRLVTLAAVAGVASAFAPSTPLAPRSSFVMPSSSRLYETVAPEVDPSPYKTHTLEEVLTEAAEKFDEIVKHGIPANAFGKLPEKAVPSLDPFNAGTISMPIKTKTLDVKLTMNDGVITGFDSIKMTSKPTLDFKEFKVGMSFHIDELKLSTEDYDREGTMGFLKLDKMDRELTVTLPDISVDFVLDLDFPELYKPTLTVVEDESKLSIGKLKTDLEGSFLFNIIAPLLKGKLTSIVGGKLVSLVDVLATAKLQQACEKQTEWVDRFNKMYMRRKATPLLVDAEGSEMKPQVLSGLGGVGQLPIPMWWEVVSPPKDKMPRISMQEILDTAKTGDIIMCSGTASGSYTIRRWTQSPYSHVILCVKEPTLLDGKLVMIQATSSPHFDLILKEHIAGIQVNDIGDFMIEYKEEWITESDDPACLAFRRLTHERKRKEEEKKMTESLVNFIKETNGLKYAEAWEMIPLYLLGLTGAELLEERKGKEFYCASYIAEALMQWGLIDKEFLSQQYSPRDFSEKYNTLPFVDSTTSYGPEHLVEIP